MSSLSVTRGRTNFADGIVAEFWMPQKVSFRVVIICDGAPSVPSKNKLAEFFARKGYWVFHIRYRGTWESGGEFLKQSPANDIDDVIDALQFGFMDIYSKITYLLDVREVTIVGASFAGPAVILATRNPLVKSAIALAPVIDWSAQEKFESIEEFVGQISAGFPGAYRCPKKNYRKLLRPGFYDVVSKTANIDGEKLFLVHARDDESVPYMPTRKFAKKIGASYVEYPTGGHLGSSTIMNKELWGLLKAFLAR